MRPWAPWALVENPGVRLPSSGPGQSPGDQIRQFLGKNHKMTDFRNSLALRDPRGKVSWVSQESPGGLFAFIPIALPEEQPLCLPPLVKLPLFRTLQQLNLSYLGYYNSSSELTKKSNHTSKWVKLLKEEVQ